MSVNEKPDRKKKKAKKEKSSGKSAGESGRVGNEYGGMDLSNFKKNMGCGG
jgi:hypothetical protein